MPVIVAWDTPTRLAAVRFTDIYIRSAAQRSEAEPTGKVTMIYFAANGQQSSSHSSNSVQTKGVSTLVGFA